MSTPGMPVPSKSVEQTATIIKLLELEDLTIAELADKSGLNYYTVRNRVNDLMLTGKAQLSAIKDRARVYTLANNTVPEEYIPYITSLISRKRHKAIDLLSQVGHEEEMKSLQACREIPEIVTRLLHLAILSSHSMEIDKPLNDLKQQVNRNVLSIRNASSTYEQMLADSRWWDSKELKKMVNDTEFLTEEITRAFDYYEKKAKKHG
jgi:hypothetical protein